MKFVTVMDMWLLIVNIILLGLIGYYGRRLIKMISRIVSRIDQDQIEKERRAIVSMIREERDILMHQSSMSGLDAESFTIEILDLLADKVQDRNNKRLNKQGEAH